jgi:sporulation protein YtfJ
MSEHPLQGLMTTALENLKEMVDVNTIIGDPIETLDGSTVILPVSKVGFGFAAGGSNFQMKNQHKNSDSSGRSESDTTDNSSSGNQNSGNSMPFGGGSGGGVSISPVAFLIVTREGVKMVHLDQYTHLYERIIDFAPQAVEKLQQMFSSSKGEEKKKKSENKSSKEERNKEDTEGKEEKDQEKPPPMKL